MNESATCVSGAFSNRGDPIEGVLELVDRVGRELGVSAELLTDLRIALDEVVTNIVNYAYTDNAQHQFTIRCEIRGGSLATIVEDDGIAYDPLRAPAPDLSASLDNRRVGGLGVHFVKNLMSAVRYERIGGRNRLTLEQDLNKKEKA